MRRFANLSILMVMFLNAGCQAASPLQTNVAPIGNEAVFQATAAPPEIPTQAAATPDRMEASMSKTPERIPKTEEPIRVTGEVPLELLDSMLKDLTARTGAALEQVSIIRGQAVVWNDGSLGCPQPGVMYTQALINGYWVELEIAGKKFDYRASETGYFFLCEGGFRPGILPVTPDS